MSYSPTLGRWMEEDPLDYVNGASMYQSRVSSPVTDVDPFGTKAYDLGIVPSFLWQNWLGYPPLPPTINGMTRWEAGVDVKILDTGLRDHGQQKGILLTADDWLMTASTVRNMDAVGTENTWRHQETAAWDRTVQPVIDELKPLVGQLVSIDQVYRTVEDAIARFLWEMIKLWEAYRFLGSFGHLPTPSELEHSMKMLGSAEDWKATIVAWRPLVSGGASVVNSR
jgi:hypothetical protein